MKYGAKLQPPRRLFLQGVVVKKRHDSHSGTTRPNVQRVRSEIWRWDDDADCQQCQGVTCQRKQAHTCRMSQNFATFQRRSYKTSNARAHATERTLPIENLDYVSELAPTLVPPPSTAEPQQSSCNQCQYPSRIPEGGTYVS